MIKKLVNQLFKLLQQHSFTVFFIYVAIITTGSLWPRLSEHYQTGEIASGLTPKEGDNFKLANYPAVYRLEEGKRRQYTSDTSFFNHSENKPFDTPYELGGILICDKETVFSFPMGDYMPLEPGGVGKKYKQELAWDKFKTAFFRSDKVVHCFSYAVFAIFLLVVLQQYPQWSKFTKTIIVFLVGTLVGGSIEWLQFEFIPGRDKELLDLLFNTVGLVLGTYLYNKFITQQ